MSRRNVERADAKARMTRDSPRGRSSAECRQLWNAMKNPVRPHNRGVAEVFDHPPHLGTGRTVGGGRAGGAGVNVGGYHRDLMW